MAEIKDNILPEEFNITEEELLRYVSGQGDEEERRRVAEALDKSPFLADSAEGLRHFSSIDDARRQASVLNRQLLAQLPAKRKNLSKKEPVSFSLLLWLMLAFILLLVLIGYWIITKAG